MSHTASTVDTLLIRPTHGDQTGAGDNERTDHWEGIRNEPVRKRVTPEATNTKPADQNNQIGGSQPHSLLISAMPVSADRALLGVSDSR